MIRSVIAPLLLFLPVAIHGAAAAQITPASYCRQVGGDDTLRPVPPLLAPAVIRLFHLGAMPAAQVSRSTSFRCAEHQVLVCTVGANLNCGKADTRRNLPAVDAWCAGHPGSSNVPAYVTGHATIYLWRCDGPRPVAAQSALSVDERGFVSQNWKRIGSE